MAGNRYVMAARSAFELSAARVANASPQLFNEMIAELEKVHREALDALSVAPADQILKQQGYAQAYGSFIRMFKECSIRRPSEQPKPHTAT